MRSAIRCALWLLARLVVPLRYRIRVHGWERVRGLKGPVLAAAEPSRLHRPRSHSHDLYGAFRPRPVLYEENFRSPVLRPLVKLLRAVPIPDLDRPSHEALERTEQARGRGDRGAPPRGELRPLAGRAGAARRRRAAGRRPVADRHPAGRPRRGRRPGADPRRLGQHVHLRPDGAYASASGGASGTGLLWLAANLLFFMPRRRVDITIEPLDRGKLPELERDPVNRWFEAWYNADGPERPTYVPYHFLFGPRSYEFPPLSAPAEGEIVSDQVRPETREAVAEILADKLGRPLTADELHPDTPLDDLGLDSLQRMELALAVEQRFGFSADPAPVTVGQLMALAQGLVEKEPPKPPPPEWFRAPSDEEPLRILGETIPEAFVARALADRRGVAAADDLAGVVTYERLLVGALVMARRFARLPAANVGLMLPASVACDTMLLGLSLAGKLPVLLNWTTGPANLHHAARLTGLTHVITSWRLRDRLGLAIEGVQFLDVEDLRRQVGWFERLRTLLAVRLLPGSVRRRVPQALPDASAVILFTSGSEKAPKAVPLTHRNILSQPAGCPGCDRADASGRCPRLPADVPQLRPHGDGAAAAAGGRAGRPSPRPDRRRGAGPQGRRLPADPCRRHADLHRAHPRARQAGRAGLAAARSSSARRSVRPPCSRRLGAWCRGPSCWKGTASRSARRWSR